MEPEDLEPLKKKKEVRNLDPLSIDELKEYIEELEEEIARVEAEIAKKDAVRAGAEAFFKKP